MLLTLTFAGFFALGWLRAARAGGGTADKLRYGAIHGLAATLVVFAVATVGDFTGLFS
ncbi:MAG: hypothetical protein AAF192_04405 [Pseudomonadota bacterium]